MRTCYRLIIWLKKLTEMAAWRLEKSKLSLCGCLPIGEIIQTAVTKMKCLSQPASLMYTLRYGIIWPACKGGFELIVARSDEAEIR